MLIMVTKKVMIIGKGKIITANMMIARTTITVTRAMMVITNDVKSAKIARAKIVIARRKALTASVKTEIAIVIREI